MKEQYKYYSEWSDYAFEEEENRFLSSNDEDLLKICDRIELNSPERQKKTGGIPIHYDRNKEYLYVLKEGPHTRVGGETGSKKSRTVCRGNVISAILNGDSFISVDPKGEISSDNKIQQLCKQYDQEIYVLDFRTMDKDGYNIFSNIIEAVEQGEKQRANDEIERFGAMMLKGLHAEDPYWDIQGGELVKSSQRCILMALGNNPKLLRKAFNLASIKAFISQDKEKVERISRHILEDMDTNLTYNPVQRYNDIAAIAADRTYSCIVSSANALLADFCASEDLIRMLSTQTFDVRDFYKRPSGVFIVVPDEVSSYDRLVGYIIDMMYQSLVSFYTRTYQGKEEPLCKIKFICDEMASLKINEMSNKISASRSRDIEWTIIYQSEKQMDAVYPEDFGTICGNCKHHIFLGSTDYDILKRISAQTGTTCITANGGEEYLVKVEDLRRMKKERTYKDALVITGNYLYCAKLPDYDYFSFLKEGTPMKFVNRIESNELLIYTPSELYEDFYNEKIKMNYGI